MEKLTRRQALAVSGAAATVALGSTAVAQEAEKLESSGDTASSPLSVGQTIELKDVPALAAGQVRTLFGRISPDASPGSNTLTITGLPAGTRSISVWMTERAAGNKPHAVGAFYYTESVQLYDNGTKCRVRYRLSWTSHLPTAAQVIYG